MFEPPLVDGQTLGAVDVRDLTPDRDWGQNCTGTITPGPLETQAKEAGVLFTDQQDRLVNPPTEPTPSNILPSSRHGILQVEEPIGRSTPLRAPATASRGQARPPASRRFSDDQWLGEPSAVWNGPASSGPCGRVRVQKQSNSAVSDPVERPQTADGPALQVLVVQEPNHEPVPIQRHNSGECHRTVPVNEEVEVLRKEGSNQDPFPDISWDGWELVKTPDGVYLPETFNPFPHELEDLTDQRQLSKEN